jgi:thiosulfate/3-mercaptopyruvate sulfurtransferase
MPSSLITADELAELIARQGDGRTPPVHVLDVRWRLDRPDGRSDYLAGHLPGAVYVDLETQLACHGAPTDGRHPIPPVEALQGHSRSWGIDDGDTVVVYDNLMNLSSARAWWLLRDAGIADVRVLDGALRSWIKSGRGIVSGEVVPAHGNLVLRYGHLATLTIDEAAALPMSGILLDARASERYRGEVEPVDPRAGHIPGALSAPATENVDSEGRFLDPQALRERFIALGVAPDLPLGVYCGSGVTAAHDVLALTLAGFAPALYPGSWSQWSNSAARPVAVSIHPEGEASSPSN